MRYDYNMFNMPFNKFKKDNSCLDADSSNIKWLYNTLIKTERNHVIQHVLRNFQGRQLTIHCRWIKDEGPWTWVPNPRQIINTWLHQCHLQTEWVWSWCVVEPKSFHMEQFIQCSIPAVQIIIIYFIWNENKFSLKIKIISWTRDVSMNVGYKREMGGWVELDEYLDQRRNILNGHRRK